MTVLYQNLCYIKGVIRGLHSYTVCESVIWNSAMIGFCLPKQRKKSRSIQNNDSVLKKKF